MGIVLELNLAGSPTPTFRETQRRAIFDHWLNTSPGAANSGAGKRTVSMKIKTILLVDKDLTVAEAIAISLGQKGVTFYFALNMEAAKLILADHGRELDLMVAEVEPHGHALELLKTIKTYREATLPMIVFGSDANLRANAEALSREECKVMRMPIDFMQLWTDVASIDGTELVIHPPGAGVPQSVKTAA